MFQCSEPGIVSDDNNCNKFWLCKEETEGSGVLEVMKMLRVSVTGLNMNVTEFLSAWPIFTVHTNMPAFLISHKTLNTVDCCEDGVGFS